MNHIMKKREMNKCYKKKNNHYLQKKIKVLKNSLLQWILNILKRIKVRNKNMEQLYNQKLLTERKE